MASSSELMNYAHQVLTKLVALRYCWLPSQHRTTLSLNVSLKCIAN